MELFMGYFTAEEMAENRRYRLPQNMKTKLDRDNLPKRKKKIQKKKKKTVMKVRARVEKLAKETPLGAKERVAKRLKHVQSRYGLPKHGYSSMLRNQRHCCNICRKHQRDLPSTLCVDHCHTTGKVRGLLCNKCNTAIGLLEESLKTVRSAARYLKKHQTTLQDYRL